jgi:CRP/FNR family transcriptional regulator
VLFKKGENLTKQGAFASYVLFIVTGYVKQYIEAEGNNGFNLRIIRPGEFIGLSSVFGGNTFSYSATAITDTRAFLIEKDAIARLVKSDGKFAFSIVSRYMEQSQRLLETIHKLVYRQMNGRLAGTLLYLSPEGYTGENIFSALTRKDIAEFAGISTESTVKLLKSFEKDGLVKLKEKDILILDRGRLSEISRRG